MLVLVCWSPKYIIDDRQQRLSTDTSRWRKKCHFEIFSKAKDQNMILAAAHPFLMSYHLLPVVPSLTLFLVADDSLREFFENP